MNVADSLVDLLCYVRVPFMLFGGLLVSLSRSLRGAHGAQAGLPHPLAGLLLTHGSSLPTHTFADTDNARHDRDRPGSGYTAASRRPDRAEIQASIDKLLARRLVDDPQKMLSEFARLGARLIIQRAVEDEFDTWLGRARYERRPKGVAGEAQWVPPSDLQTGRASCGSRSRRSGEAVIPFVSTLFPKWHCKRLLRTDPLKALVIGGFVRGLSMRDVESLCEEAGLGKTSKSTVATICAELHERFKAFCRGSLYDINLSSCSWTRSTCQFVRAPPRRA
jgi:hypothetical protein